MESEVSINKSELATEQQRHIKQLERLAVLRLRAEKTLFNPQHTPERKDQAQYMIGLIDHFIPLMLQRSVSLGLLEETRDYFDVLNTTIQSTRETGGLGPLSPARGNIRFLPLRIVHESGSIIALSEVRVIVTPEWTIPYSNVRGVRIDNQNQTITIALASPNKKSGLATFRTDKNMNVKVEYIKSPFGKK